MHRTVRFPPLLAPAVMSADIDPASPGPVISSPVDGGAVSGIDMRPSPDLSTGNGNDPFGFGWAQGLPGCRGRHHAAVPRYRDDDAFVLPGAKEPVPVAGTDTDGPRASALFARIVHIAGDFWEARRKDSLRTRRYGTPGSAAIARRARAVARYDEAGLVTVKDVAFKGNVLKSVRRLIDDIPAARSTRHAQLRPPITTGY